MKTITQMRESIEALMKQLGDIKARLVAEDREYNAEEKKTVIEIQARVRELQEQIELEEETQRLEKEMDRSQTPPTKPDPGAGNGEHRRIEIPHDPDPDQFRSMSEFFGAVIVAGRDNRVDPRLMRFDPRETRATGLSEGVGSEGGFLVPPNFSQELLKSVWDYAEVLAKVRKITLTQGNSLTMPRVNESSRADGSRWGGVQMYWAAEAGSKTPSKPDFGQVELKLKKLVGLVYLTDELIEDVSALGGYIQMMFTDEMRFKIMDALYTGTGAGQPLGILNAGCLVTQAKETGQVATTIVTENIVKMWSRMIASSRPNAVWHINQDIEPQLYTMGIQVGLGGSPIFMPAGGLSNSPYNTLLGRPIIPLEQCSTLGTVGDIALCDWSQYIAIDKGNMQQASSIHVKFVYDETCLRFVYRFDGEPWPQSAITPHSGSSNTLSPFVVLATRE